MSGNSERIGDVGYGITCYNCGSGLVVISEKRQSGPLYVVRYKCSNCEQQRVRAKSI